MQTIGEMPFSNRKVIYEGNKQDDPPPVAEALVVETSISPQLSHRGEKHYGRPFGGETNNKLRPRQVGSGKI